MGAIVGLIIFRNTLNPRAMLVTLNIAIFRPTVTQSSCTALVPHPPGIVKMNQGVLEPGVADSLGSSPHRCGAFTRTSVTAIVIEVAIPD